MSGSSGDVGSLIVDDFVVTGDEEDMTLIGDDGEDYSNTTEHAPDYEGDDTNIGALTGMPINCPDDDDDNQRAMRGFKFYENDSKNVYGYQCSTLENPGSLQFGKVGNYKSHRGDISDLHGSQALCASNQALVGFVLDQNKSGTQSGYRYDCIDIKGPAKVRTAITPYKPYHSGEDAALVDVTKVPKTSTDAYVRGYAVNDDFPPKQLETLKAIKDISCREGELLQGFATEKSGNNMRYIYRCITPGYEAD